MHTLFDIQLPKLTWGGGLFLWVNHAPSQGGGAPSRPIFGFPSHIYVHPLSQKYQMLHGNTWGSDFVFGASHAPTQIKRGRGPSAPRFCGFRSIDAYTLCRRTTIIDVRGNTGKLTDITETGKEGRGRVADPLEIRLVFELGPREHVTPCLLQLHWLPVRWRIQFKLCCIMHSVFNGNCPAYLRHRSDSECQQTASSPTIMGAGTGGAGWASAHPGNFSRGLKTSWQ